MKQKTKATFFFRIVCLVLMVAMVLPFGLAGCSEQHVCGHKCEICGYCTDKNCEEKECEQKCRGHNESVTVTSVEITNNPKTEYLTGEVFDITNLIVKANLSNGKSKTIRDSKFTEWTHKGEPLTEDVTKITFTLPGYDFTFDLAITVSMPADLSLVVDTQTLKTSYTTDESINFSTITVKLMTGSVAEVLASSDWYLTYNGERVEDITSVSAKTLGAGEKTFTVVYLPTITKEIKVTIINADETISPAFIEAEDCAYRLSNEGKETTEKYVTKESKTYIQYYDSENKTVQVLNTRGFSNGSSGAGAVSSLSQNGKTVYFKFKVKVPAAGSYKILARSNAVGGGDVKGKFAININGATEDDGSFTFISNDVSSSKTRGSQLKDYAANANITLQGTSSDYKDYYSMFWWGFVDLGSYELIKGENEIRIYIPNGYDINIDYFEIVESDRVETTKIINMREGVRVDCSIAGNKVYLTKGETLTDIFDIPSGYPFKYSLLYIRTTKGKEIPVLSTMLDAASIDYTKTGEQTVTVTDPVSKESASFTLVIEERKTND